MGVCAYFPLKSGQAAIDAPAQDPLLRTLWEHAASAPEPVCHRDQAGAAASCLWMGVKTEPHVSLVKVPTGSGKYEIVLLVFNVPDDCFFVGFFLREEEKRKRRG